MADRVVSVELVANASGLVRGVRAAKDAVGELRDEVQDSAMSQREAWSRIGTGLTAVGVAMTGVMALTLKTGIAYNTLQQTSRAALRTLLGSATAANAQMDKLDDFARNSPFAKQTFIQAQQQMLAFGIETEKVIPYLDAVQNGVAAMGGSNAEIEAIVTIMSKIQSSAKITATDLMQFGNHGVDAAQLIGSQMNKTAGEIRADITSGALDAGQALDALAAGMQDRFGGAAANVKDTFEGAMDRVRAAFRDFASELAKPLVDPDGGGALVDLLNWSADALRNFEKLPEPVKATVTALTGVAGVGALLTGTAILAIPKWLEFRAALHTVGVTGATVRSGMGNLLRFLGGPWGIAMLTATLTVAAFNKAMSDSKVSAADFETSIKQGKSALDGMAETASKNEQGLTRLFVNVSDQVENLGPLLDRAATSGRGFWSSLTFNEQAALDNLSEFGSALASLAADDLPRAQREFAKFGDEAELSRGQLATALGEMPGFKDALLDYADAAGMATDDTTLLKLAMGELGPAAGENVASLEEIQGAAEDTTQAVTDLADQILNFGKANIDAERASLAFEEQLSLLNERVKEGATGLDRSTEAGQANYKSLLDIAEAASKSAAATFEATGNQEAANATLERGREALIRAAKQYGMTEADAKAYADQILATPESVTTKAKLDTAAAERNLASWLGRIPSVIPISLQAKWNEPGQPGFAQSLINRRAHGGTVGFAQGGTVLKAASGITVPGFGGGVTDGTVWGAGTAKSDSVNVWLSRGEEVIQEPYASAHRSLLKSINRGELMPSMMQSQIVMPSAGPMSVSLEGATIRLNVDGQQMTGFVEKQIVSADRRGKASLRSGGTDRRQW